jgi:hypothetical protein
MTDLENVRCSCGWVGTYINKHKSMMRRKGDEREHTLMGNVEERSESDG